MCNYRRIAEELIHCSDVNKVKMYMREDMTNPNKVVIQIDEKHIMNVELDYYIISHKLQKLGYKGFRFQVRPEHLIKRI